MARKRYPSDDARLKRPSGVVVAYSIMTPDPDHPEQTQVFADPEKRGIWTGLVVLAGSAFAGRTGDRVTLTDAHLSWCTGRAQRRHALSALRVVCELMGYSVNDRGHCVIVHVKNLSQNQGWTPQDSADTPRTPSAPQSQSQSEREREHSSADSAEHFPSGNTPEAKTPDVDRLANLIAPLEGDRDEKLAWLRSGVGLQILGAADAELPDDATPRQRSGKLAQITAARYGAYLKAERKFRGAANVTAHKAKRAAQASRDPPLRVVDPQDPDAYESSSTMQSMFDN